MFEEIAKLYEVEWVKDEIKLLDLGVTIKAPYDKTSVEGNDKRSVQRL